MAVLALDSALTRCSAVIAAEDRVLVARQQDDVRDQSGVLPRLLHDCLQASGTSLAALQGIAVTVGPGSFTGIRSGLALAWGLGIGAGCPVVGVTIGEALAEAVPERGGRPLWCAVPSRRGRIFLQIGKRVLSLAVDEPSWEPPWPDHPIAVAGSAAAALASRLAAGGADVMLTQVGLPDGHAVARVGYRRLRGFIEPCAAEPLYVDPPLTTPPPPAPQHER